jgi:hypothetical protein
MTDQTNNTDAEEIPQPLNVIDNLMSMHKEEREAMFAALTDNKDLFNKMIPGLLDPLMDPTQEHEHPLFKHYKDWARTPK